MSEHGVEGVGEEERLSPGPGTCSGTRRGAAAALLPARDEPAEPLGGSGECVIMTLGVGSSSLGPRPVLVSRVAMEQDVSPDELNFHLGSSAHDEGESKNIINLPWCLTTRFSHQTGSKRVSAMMSYLVIYIPRRSSAFVPPAVANPTIFTNRLPSGTSRQKDGY